MKDLLDKFGKRGSFFRTAFSSFSSQDLMEFFENRGLEFKVEDGGRVFPVTDDSKSVLKILETSMKEMVLRLFTMPVFKVLKHRLRQEIFLS